MNDHELYSAIEQATTAYHRARAFDAACHLGSDALHAAVEWQEIEDSADAVYSPAERAQFLALPLSTASSDVLSPDSVPQSPSARLDRLTVAFDRRAESKFKRCGIYWLNCVDREDIQLTSEQGPFLVRDGTYVGDELSMVALTAQVDGQKLVLAKYKVYGSARQQLKVTDGDRKILSHAADRVTRIAAHLNSYI